MALDKQKILNELGNVVNQLQSADCGCMGKLFSNSNQGNPPAPMMNSAHGCCHGHCHGCHGFNAPGAGEPYSNNGHCMGSCNPPKLYADTYSYLNQNLMQPAVKEVYNDLKSITPNNTMMNSPIAAQMGLTQAGNPNAGGAGGMAGGGNTMGQSQMGGLMGNPNATSNMIHGPNLHFGASNSNTAQMNNPNNQQQMAHMAGAGPHIMNMIKGDTGLKPKGMPNQIGQQAGLMGNTVPLLPEMPGQYSAEMTGNNPSQYATGNMGMNNTGQGNFGSIQNPTTQYMLQQNAQGMPMSGKMAQRNGLGNGPMGGVRATSAIGGNMASMNSQGNAMSGNSMSMGGGHNAYGLHNAGIAKFKEMFPGVITDDLGFDPMALAIQMNPANQQQVAYDTMHKMLMSNNDLSKLNAESAMKPLINGTNAAAANIAQSNQQMIGQIPPPGHIPIQQYQPPVPNAGAAPSQYQIPPQQVYSALTGAPAMSQLQIPPEGMPPQQQQIQYQQQYQGGYQEAQNPIDPATLGAVINRTLPTVYEGDSNAVQQGAPPTSTSPPAVTGDKMIMDPIFPADTSKNIPTPDLKSKYYQYNTLGQPVEMLPSQIYHPTIPPLPQTLSPQSVPSRTRSDPMKYSNVKSTVSKTSLMGTKSAASKTQMQHLYNQYKGSHSFTQQNIRPSDNGASYSEGHLNVQQKNEKERQTPIEKVGDTTENKVVVTPVKVKEEQPPEQVGDVPETKKPAPVEEKAPTPPTGHAKLRNGLQDQTYTPYSCVAWSFHGDCADRYTVHRRRCHRYRNRY